MKNKKSSRYFLIFFAISFMCLASFFVFSRSSSADYSYTPMERVPGFETAAKDFPSFVLSLYKFGIWAIGICALLMITVGGFFYLVSAGNTSKMDIAKKIITDAILGLIIALGAYFLLFTINPDLVNVNISLKPFSGSGASGVSSGGNVAGGSCSYQTPSSGQNVCAGTTCSKNCSNSKYDSSINTYASANGLDPKIVKAIMCIESNFSPTAVNSSTNACGLMQVMPQGGNCQSDPRGNLLDPVTNIKVGTQLLAQKYNAVSSSYSTVTRDEMVFAAYNCCANGQNPNSASSDCGSNVPKWACPINPGTGSFNMCTVKSYACGVEACAK